MNSGPVVQACAGQPALLRTNVSVSIMGFAPKTIPQGAPSPAEHSIYNICDSAWDWLLVEIWTSLIIVLLFLGSIGKGLLSMGKQSIRRTRRCRATCCYKKPELLGWDPLRPPE